jgi:hypothetical protein
MNFDVDQWKAAPEVKKRMDAIKSGTAPDKHGWMFRI